MNELLAIGALERCFDLDDEVPGDDPDQAPSNAPGPQLPRSGRYRRWVSQAPWLAPCGLVVMLATTASLVFAIGALLALLGLLPSVLRLWSCARRRVARSGSGQWHSF